MRLNFFLDGDLKPELLHSSIVFFLAPVISRHSPHLGIFRVNTKNSHASNAGETRFFGTPTGSFRFRVNIVSCFGYSAFLTAQHIFIPPQSYYIFIFMTCFSVVDQHSESYSAIGRLRFYVFDFFLLEGKFYTNRQKIPLLRSYLNKVSLFNFCLGSTLHILRFAYN